MVTVACSHCFGYNSFALARWEFLPGLEDGKTEEKVRMGFRSRVEGVVSLDVGPDGDRRMPLGDGRRECQEGAMKPDKVKQEMRRDKGAGRGQKSSGGSSSSGRVKKDPADSQVKVEGGDEAFLVNRKPGQKYPTPPPGYAEREFYESLLKQKPESLMAQDWCLSYGVCSEEEAHLLYKKVCKRKDFLATSQTSPVGSPKKTKSMSSSSGGGRPRSKQPREMEADTGFDPGNAFEGVGTSGL